MTLQTPHEVVDSPVFRFSEACAYLKVGETTLRGLVTNGRLPIVRIGRGVRFTQWALDEYLRAAESTNAD